MAEHDAPPLDIMNDPNFDPTPTAPSHGSGEPDHCRICRSEGSPDEPLYHPCKCSGSIKFVHQDCLMEWLGHSKKKYCELCKTPFTFTKVYDPNMPSRIPTPLFIKQIFRHLLQNIIFWIRTILVAFVWLGWLPWCVRWMWRGWFWVSDGGWWAAQVRMRQAADAAAAVKVATSTTSVESAVATETAAGFFGLFASPSPTPTVAVVEAVGNATIETVKLASEERGIFFDHNPFEKATRFPAINQALADVVEGELLTVLIVVSFIIIFLIREWVVQQQPGGLLDDFEAPVVDPGIQNPVQEIENDGPVQAGEDVADVELLEAAFGPLPAEERHEDEHEGAQAGERIRHRPMARPRRRRYGVEAEGTDNEDPVTTPEYGNRSGTPTVPPARPPLTREATSQATSFRRDLEEGTTGHSTNFDFGGPSSSTENLFTFGQSSGRKEEEGEKEEGEEDVLESWSEYLERDVERTEDTTTLGDVSAALFAPESESTVHRESVSRDSNGSSFEFVNDDIPSSSDKGKAPETRQTVDNDGSIWESEGEDERPRAGPSEWSTAAQNGDVPVDRDETTPTDDNHRDAAEYPREDPWNWVNGNIPADDAPHVENHPVALPPPPPPPQVVDVPPPPPPAPAADDPNLDDMADIDDDFDGILELLGIRGPLVGLLQNAAISSMLITATVAIGVAFPYVVGKTVMMILAHPLLFLVYTPFRVFGWLVEVCVDSALVIACGGMAWMDHVVRLLLKPIGWIFPGLSILGQGSKLARFFEAWSRDGLARVTAKFSGVEMTYSEFRRFPPSAVPPVGIVAKDAARRFMLWSSEVLKSIGLGSVLKMEPSIGPVEISVFSTTVPNPVHTIKDWGAGIIAPLNFTRSAVSNVTDSKVIAAQLSMLDGKTATVPLYQWTTWDRILVVLLGYAFFTIAGGIYVRRRRTKMAEQPDVPENQREVEQVIVEFLEQCGGVLKVVGIIGIEMVVFPLYCGILLDLALLPLFPTPSNSLPILTNRLQFTLDNPITSTFIHWFIGTCYMFHFALFVSMCRKIMRPGVLYFIRDPDDPTFHPVRDVLDRPVLLQLRKIAFSGGVYGVLVLICLGGVVFILRQLSSSILPIQWNSTEPVLELPLDLLFYNFMIPIVMKFLRPSSLLQSLYTWWFHRLARWLRLSSFMFGTRKPDEEGHHVYPSTLSYFTSFFTGAQGDPNKPALVAKDWDEPYFQTTGRFVRAPAIDSVRHPKGSRVFIPVTRNNLRLDLPQEQAEADQLLQMRIDAQEKAAAEAAEAGDNQPAPAVAAPAKREWKFCYIPPWFRLRVGLVVVGIWAFAAVTGCAVTIAPLLVGRTVVGHFMDGKKRVGNDIYALSVGAYILGGIVLLGMQVPKAYRYIKQTVSDIRAYSTRPTEKPTTTPVVGDLVKVVTKTMNMGLLVVLAGIVLPTLLSLVLELYILLPLHSLLPNTQRFRSEPAMPHVPANTTFSGALPSPVLSVDLPATGSAIGGTYTLHLLQSWTLGLLYLKLLLRLVLMTTNPLGESIKSIFPTLPPAADAPANAAPNYDYWSPKPMQVIKVVGGAIIATAILLALPASVASTIIYVLGYDSGSEMGVRVWRYAAPGVMALGAMVGVGWGVKEAVNKWEGGVRDEVWLRGVRVHNHGESGVDDKVGGEGDGVVRAVIGAEGL